MNGMADMLRQMGGMQPVGARQGMFDPSLVQNTGAGSNPLAAALRGTTAYMQAQQNKPQGAAGLGQIAGQQAAGQGMGQKVGAGLGTLVGGAFGGPGGAMAGAAIGGQLGPAIGDKIKSIFNILG